MKSRLVATGLASALALSTVLAPGAGAATVGPQEKALFGQDNACKVALTPEEQKWYDAAQVDYVYLVARVTGENARKENPNGAAFTDKVLGNSDLKAKLIADFKSKKSEGFSDDVKNELFKYWEKEGQAIDPDRKFTEVLQWELLAASAKTAAVEGREAVFGQTNDYWFPALTVPADVSKLPTEEEFQGIRPDVRAKFATEIEGVEKTAKIMRPAIVKATEMCAQDTQGDVTFPTGEFISITTQQDINKSDTPDGSSKLGAGGIAGIVIGSLAGVAALIAAVYAVAPMLGIALPPIPGLPA